MMKLTIVVLFAVIGVSLASSDDGPITAKTIQKVGASAYVYNPLLLGTNGTQVGSRCTDEERTDCSSSSCIECDDPTQACLQGGDPCHTGNQGLGSAPILSQVLLVDYNSLSFDQNAFLLSEIGRWIEAAAHVGTVASIGRTRRLSDGLHPGAVCHEARTCASESHWPTVLDLR